MPERSVYVTRVGDVSVPVLHRSRSHNRLLASLLNLGCGRAVLRLLVFVTGSDNWDGSQDPGHGATTSYRHGASPRATRLET